MAADKRILVVDDDVSIATLVVQVLQGEGLQATAVTSVREAMARSPLRRPIWCFWT